ncbi:immunoglobulin-like domain-containing protein [Saccharibacillus sacchari]|uniref:immunoglobulin-like domain-containing protein n=1 Tax=Saccharibacillus sacchari TaxID=456493 RepID=UPI000A04C15B|nr:immunoglobulin-like domain-containing protein [Saccharibacillus sacchari]
MNIQKRRSATARLWKGSLRLLMCVMLVTTGMFAAGGLSVRAEENRVTASDWATLYAALRDSASGTIIELDRNISEQGRYVAVPAGRSLTLDLSGYDLSIETSEMAAAIGVPQGASLAIRATGGGSLTARGGMYGAGIGGGRNETAGTIIIESGTVTATGGTFGAGIGGGYQGAGGEIRIEGGTVVLSTDAGTGPAVGAGNSASRPFFSLINTGTITIPSGQQLNVPAGVTVENAGIINGQGKISGSGRVYDTGTISVSVMGPQVVHDRYTLTFELNGGTSAVPSPIVLYATSLEQAGLMLPASPTRAGYSFEGWYTESVGGEQVTRSTVISRDLTLHARWQMLAPLTVVLTTTANDPTNKLFEVVASFSENTAGFDVTDVQVVNGLAQSVVGNGQTYTLNILPTAEGAVQIAIPAGAVQSARGVLNTASNVLSLQYDATAPTVALTTTAGNSVNGSFEVTATFSEDVVVLDEGRIEVVNGTASNVRASGTNRVYSFDVAPDGEGAVTVNMSAGAFRDAAGNGNVPSAPLSRIYDMTAPVIKLNGENPTVVGIGANFSDPGAAAEDDQGGDLSSMITVSGAVDTNQAGAYELVYRVSDPADNEAEAKRIVHVIEPPVLTLNGKTDMTIEEGGIFLDPGATASDSYYGDLADRIRTQGTVDSQKPGVYTLRYTVDNPIGQTAAAERKVTVNKASVVQPPVIPAPSVPSPVDPVPSDFDSSVSGSAGDRAGDGKLTLAAGQAGEESLGSGIWLRIPTGATDRQADIEIRVLPSSESGLPDGVESLGPTYKLTKSDLSDFLRPANLTLTFDPAKLSNGERAAVFYRKDSSDPWSEIEGGTIESGKDAIGQDLPDRSRITVEVSGAGQFAVLAAKKAEAGNEGASGGGAEMPSADFADLSGHWAANLIREAVSSGIVKGYADGTFRPAEAVTRAEFTAMLVRTLLPTGSAADAALPEADNDDRPELTAFADRAAIRAWSRESAAQAYALGWIQGDTDGNFRPDEPITRAEMAVMLVRALNLKGSAEAAPIFRDSADIPAWAEEATAALAEAGLLQGRPDGRFAPNAPSTRAEAVQVLMTTNK